MRTPQPRGCMHIGLALGREVQASPPHASVWLGGGGGGCCLGHFLPRVLVDL